jgi:hypothetical protein
MSIDALDTTFEAEATEAFRKWIPRTFERKRL